MDLNEAPKRSREEEEDAGDAPAPKIPREDGAAADPNKAEPLGRTKTLLCKYHRRGTCEHGADCTFAHSEAELQPMPNGSIHPENALMLAADRAAVAAAEAAAEADSGAAAVHPAAPVGSADATQGGGTLCVMNLPKKWEQKGLAAYLTKLGLAHTGTRKKSTWTYGFVTFGFAHEREAAVEKLRATVCEGKRLDCGDATKGAGEKGKQKGVCHLFARGTCNDTCKFSHDAARKEEVPVGAPATSAGDIRDKVSPLWRLPYARQLRQKRAGLVAVLKKVTRKMRKQCKTFEAWPSWLKGSKEHGGMCAPLEGILRSPLVGGYRNKCEFSVGLDRQGRPGVGFLLGSFKEGFTAIASPSGCRHIAHASKVLAGAFDAFLKEKSRLPVWDKRSNTGFWRLLIVREGGQVAARARAAGGVEPSYRDFLLTAADVGAAANDDTGGDGEGEGGGEGAAAVGAREVSEEEAKEAAAEMEAEGQMEMNLHGPEEVMAVVQVNPKYAGATDESMLAECSDLNKALRAACAAASPPVTLAVACRQDHWGVSNAAPDNAPLSALEGMEGEVLDYIHDVMCGLKFRISPAAFFQVNTGAAEMLYRLAGDWVAAGERSLLLDVCCGTGTIGLTLAGRVAKVVGIDICAPAIEDAKRNAQDNGVTNCEFVCGKAEDVMDRLLKEHANKLRPEGGAAGGEGEGGGDGGEAPYTEIVAIVDPPRAGLHPSVLRALRGCARLKKLVYVSCNPETLAANMLDLCKPGGSGGEAFSPVKAMAVDLFPHTEHCEAVVMFSR